MSRHEHLMKAQTALGQMIEHLKRATETAGDLDSAIQGFVKTAAYFEDTLIEAQDACVTDTREGHDEVKAREGF